MARVARRMQMATVLAGDGRFDADQHALETALRGRSARKVRAHLRRMEPVVLLAPRWSDVPGFLEELSLDLAVGEPAVGCRTVSFRTLKGRTVGEAWQFTLHVFGQLGRRGWRHRQPTTVADRRGFRWSMEQLLETAHREAPHRVALLAHGAEHLPVEVMEDLAACWSDYRERHPEGRRCTVLLAGSVDAPWLSLLGSRRVELDDYGEAEAAAAIVGAAGPLPIATLAETARFTGGIPRLVRAVGEAARRGGVPDSPEALLLAAGPVADEMRGAVDIVSAHDHLADRLHMLEPGEPLPEVEEVDHPLRMAGLVRRVRVPGGPAVVLRAPAIRTLLGG